MPAKEFAIEFAYKQKAYRGIVLPFIAGHRTFYRVLLKSEDGGNQLELMLKPSQFDLDQWEYEREEGLVYDLDAVFLEEVGNHLSQCLGRTSQQPA